MVKSQKYKLTPAAKDDLLEIGDYTFQKWGKTKAKQYHQKISKQFSLIAKHPSKGRKRDDIFKNVRSFPVEKHIIIYIIQDNFVEILRILHQSMDIDNSLNKYH